MNATDDRAAAHAQRLRARRALAEADAAVTRLKEARTRAEALLRRAAGDALERGEEPPSENPEDALRRRMRQIENRMQEADARMRLAELDANRAEETFPDERTRDEPFPEGAPGQSASEERDGDVGTRRPPPERRR